MRKIRDRRLAVLLLFCLMLTGCGGLESRAGESAETGETGAAAEAELEDTGMVSVSYDEEDLEETWTDENTVYITFEHTEVQISGSGAASEGTSVVISKAGTYVLSGTLDDGQLIIDAGKDDLIHIILNGVSMSCSSSAPFYGKQNDKIVVTLAEGTVNTLSDAESYTFESETDNEPAAALFNKQDLTVNGSGELIINGYYKNGIMSKDDLKIISGTYTVSAAETALKGKDSVTIAGGTLSLTSGGDGIKTDNVEDTDKGYIAIEGGNITVVSEHDGMEADRILQVAGGSISITADGGNSNAPAGRAMSGGGENFMGGEKPLGNEQQPGRAISGGTEMNERPGGRFENSQQPDSMDEFPESMEGFHENIEQPGSMPQEGGTAAETTVESFKGIKAGAGLYITGGTIAVDASDDAVHSNGNITISGGTMALSAGDDGIHADKALTVNGGEINIETCCEGLEGLTVTVNDGTIRLKASDDGINAAGELTAASEVSGTSGRGGGMGDMFAVNPDAYIKITGGWLYVDASGDGLDSNGSLYIEGGTVLVDGPVNGGNGALDYNGEGKVTGGVLIAAGSAAMAQNLSDAEGQAAVMVTFDTVQDSGTLINISDENKTAILSYAPSKAYQSVVISAPELIVGSKIAIYTGGSCEGGQSDGYFGNAAYTAGEAAAEMTISQAVTKINN